MNQPGSVSVVVPVYNGEKTLQRCLQAIENQMSSPHQLILADNGSTDGSLSIIQQFKLESKLNVYVLEVSKKGAAAARNAAVNIALGEWIAFTDADCEPDSDWLQTGIGLISCQEKGVVGLAGPAWGTLKGDGSAKLLGLSSLSVGLSKQVVGCAGPTGTNGFAAANLWVQKGAFSECEGFDEELVVSGEDIDLCARLYKQGGKILYSPTLVVRHQHVSGLKNMIKKMIQYGQAHAFLFKKYGQSGVYLDLPIVGSTHLKSKMYIWCNISSAEKKFIFLIAVAYFNMWLSSLLFLYVFWLAIGFRNKASQLKEHLNWRDSMWLGCLFIMKSAAMTWGRAKGSSARASVCL